MGARKTVIICVGNRYLNSDDLGPRVYESLAQREIPGDTSLVDGGLMGLDLLGFLEGAHRVVFVDVLHGFAPPGRPVILDPAAALQCQPVSYGHNNGLGYLLRMLPAVCENGLPEIVLIGAEPPVGPEGVDKIGDMALRIAMGERHGRECNTAIDAAQPGTP